MNNILEELKEPNNNIFQSELWQKYYEAVGYKCFSINFDNNNVLVIKIPLYRQKSYLYCPRGPFCSKENWHIFMRKLKTVARKENCVFVRVEPYMVPNNIIGKLGLRRVDRFSPMSRQHSPLATQILEIGKSEELLLREMKPKWRYNIKLALKKGVLVRKSNSKQDLKAFYQLSLGLKERGYTGFSYEHYEKMFEALGNNINMFVAEYEKEILAVLVVVFFGKSAIYLHGASSDNKRDLMPNHLAQWEAILEAKKRGCTIYDFWGISEKGAENERWAGITRFKKGFGGEPVIFLGIYDGIFQKFWYNLFYLFNLGRKALGK